MTKRLCKLYCDYISTTFYMHIWSESMMLAEKLKCYWIWLFLWIISEILRNFKPLERSSSKSRIQRFDLFLFFVPKEKVAENHFGLSFSSTVTKYVALDTTIANVLVATWVLVIVLDLFSLDNFSRRFVKILLVHIIFSFFLKEMVAAPMKFLLSVVAWISELLEPLQRYFFSGAIWFIPI